MYIQIKKLCNSNFEFDPQFQKLHQFGTAEV